MQYSQVFSAMIRKRTEGISLRKQKFRQGQVGEMKKEKEYSGKVNHELAKLTDKILNGTHKKHFPFAPCNL